MKKYLYKNIRLYETYSRWSADYYDGKDYFALHAACCETKKEALTLAKDMIDYLNSKEPEV